MGSSLSSLTDNLVEGLHKGKCKDCKSSLEYMTVKDSLLTFKWMDINKAIEKKLDEDLVKRFQNKSKFCDEDSNNFFLMLWKGVYWNEYMGGWERFIETSLPSKKEFYCNVTMEIITEADYKHAKRVWKYFGFQNLAQYYDLYAQSETCCLQTYSKVSERIA